MRKFLLPIINLVNLILVSVAWGLSNQTAVIDVGQTVSDIPCGTLYDITWMGASANWIAIIAFFLFIFGCAAILVAFLPMKARKFVSCAAGVMLVAAGVLFFLSLKTYDRYIVTPEFTGAFIALNVLILCAGAFSLCMSAIEFFQKKAK